jgi:hypothetical protein
MSTATSRQATPFPSTGWSLGDIAVRRVDEIELPRQTGPWLLPDATKEVLDEASWLRPDFADADVPRLASHSFAVEAGGPSSTPASATPSHAPIRPGTVSTPTSWSAWRRPASRPSPWTS